MFHFYDTLENLTFQMHPKELVWSKGLTYFSISDLGLKFGLRNSLTFFLFHHF